MSSQPTNLSCFCFHSYPDLAALLYHFYRNLSFSQLREQMEVDQRQNMDCVNPNLNRMDVATAPSGLTDISPGRVGRESSKNNQHGHSLMLKGKQ